MKVLVYKYLHEGTCTWMNVHDWRYQIWYIASFFDVYSTDAILLFAVKHLRSFCRRLFSFSESHFRNATEALPPRTPMANFHPPHQLHPKTNRLIAAVPLMTLCHQMGATRPLKNRCLMNTTTFSFLFLSPSMNSHLVSCSILFFAHVSWRRMLIFYVNCVL